MLFIHLLDGNPTYSKRVLKLLDESYDRKDRLLTSYLAVGETVAEDSATAQKRRRTSVFDSTI
jgi:hypothetical protein